MYIILLSVVYLCLISAMLFIGGSSLWHNRTCYMLFENHIFCWVCVSACSLLMITGNVFVCHAPPTFTAVTSSEQTSFCFPNRTDIHSFYVRHKFLAFGYGEHCLFFDVPPCGLAETSTFQINPLLHCSGFPHVSLLTLCNLCANRTLNSACCHN